MTTGWRARLGFLIPPGNPTVEPEMMTLAPAGVSVHFSRMVSHGETGSLEGQEERNRTQIAHIGETAALLALMKPSVIMVAHTATSYTLGRDGEKARLIALCDALVQSNAFADRVEAKVVAPLRVAMLARRTRKASESAATKVDFYTMVRGEG